MRVIFFGMECRFSRPPLAALLASEMDVCAVVVPRLVTGPPASHPPAAPASRPPASHLLGAPASSRQAFEGDRLDGVEGVDGVERDQDMPHARGSAFAPPLRTPAPPPRPARGLDLPTLPAARGVVGLARSAGVPVLAAGRLAAEETVNTLRELRPDIVVVACFPRLLPPALLRLPGHGALNVHPSLLPAYRGPFPLFWVFHDGIERAGVTVHLMDAGADTGDIVARRWLALPDGGAYADAERLCAEEGARLVVEAARALGEGRAMPRPQPATGASYARAPQPRDFVVTPDWSARRAFNFMRGVAEWDTPVRLHAGDERLTVRAAVAFDEEGTIGAPIEHAGGQVRARMSPGVLTCDADTP